MPDIFDEVEEDLRADQLRAILRRYGILLVAAAVLVVAGVGGWELWRWRQQKLALHTAATYFAAARLADGQAGPGRQEALPGLQSVARKGNAGFRTLALLREAALRAEAGDAAGAEALWLKVADADDADPLLRDAATLQWALHAVDTADPGTVLARLRPLARPENPFHGLAQETEAVLALRQGQTAAARDTLKQLSQDDSAPDGVRRRAAALLAQLAAAAPPAARAAAPAPAPAGAKAGAS